MEYIADSWTMSEWEATHGHDTEWRCEVLQGGRLAGMRRLVNAWEWNPGEGQGGHAPYEHPDGRIPVYGPKGGLEWFILAVYGEHTKCWYVVKCEAQYVTAAEYAALAGRMVPRRMIPNPDGVGRYESPWFYLEPVELALDTHHQGDDAVAAARRWVAELHTAWECEGLGWGEEIPVDVQTFANTVTFVGATSKYGVDELLGLVEAVRDEEALS